ncbi:hypothetical protein ACH5RR_009877 [Cinchona calisaya]|uniref:Uncharacterized protein n=1 Tax=Cinchona calisaya TaxID=153742 RepID=A0ABD3AFF5_9GENT
MKCQERRGSHFLRQQKRWINLILQLVTYMFLSRNPTTKSGEYLEGMLNDYVGRKQQQAKLMRAQKSTAASPKLKKSNDAVVTKFKRELYQEVLDFQSKSVGTETLSELMKMDSKLDLRGPKHNPKITVLLNHFKRKTLSSQLDSLLQQTLPFHHIWVLSFGSPNEISLRRIVESYNNSRISFISSSYDFKYYGRFQMALQTEADFVCILDDDMIPGKKMLQILSHVAGTEKYKNSVLGSIGRILPFRQKDFTFPSCRKFRSKEAGLYLPDPAYGITVDKIVQVDFLSSCLLYWSKLSSLRHPSLS